MNSVVASQLSPGGARKTGTPALNGPWPPPKQLMLAGFSGRMSEVVVVVLISISEGTTELAENVSW